MKIGSLNLQNGLLLGPMAGFSDRAMRVVSHMHGAEYTVTEMVSATAVLYGSLKTHELARIRSDEGPVALQIFGKDPEIMAEGTRRLLEGCLDTPPVAIDINMGCPVAKVYGNGEGSALMKEPRLIEKITRAVTDATTLPVTVKLRAGIDDRSKNAVECAKYAEAGGASAVTVHGRTRAQMYSGLADRTVIREVKRALSIPVVANGDVRSLSDYLSIKEETGADGVMIARGAIGNPFLFSEISAFLKGEPYTPPTMHERAEMALRQLHLAVLDKGEGTAVREARGSLCHYFQSARGVARLREKIHRAEAEAEVKEILADFLQQMQT